MSFIYKLIWKIMTIYYDKISFVFLYGVNYFIIERNYYEPSSGRVEVNRKFNPYAYSSTWRLTGRPIPTPYSFCFFVQSPHFQPQPSIY